MGFKKPISGIALCCARRARAAVIAVLTWNMNSRRLMCGWPPPCKRSFDDLVGAGEDRWRHREAQCLSGIEVDDELEPGWLLDW